MKSCSDNDLKGLNEIMIMEEPKIFVSTKSIVKHISLFVVLFLNFQLQAQTPHIVYGEITLTGDTAPTLNDFEFSTFIHSRPYQVLNSQDNGMTGFYSDVNFPDRFTWFIQVGDFPSSWSVGDTLNIEIFSKITNSYQNIEVILSEEPMQYCNAVDFVNSSNDDQNINLPTTFNLSQNYPNPFNPSTQIDISIPVKFSNSITTVSIFNILGKKVITLLNKKLSTGNYTISWNGFDDFGNSAPSGIYFYSLKNSQISVIKKMTLLR